MEVSAYVKNANGDIRYEINPERVKFTESDFPGESSTSVLKIGQQLYVPQGFIDENGGEIVARWRYYRENYIYPYDLDGWSDWFVFDVKFPLKLEAVSGTITGPNQICDQGTYTITNYGDVTLRNAANIATVNRIQGTDQFTVSRIGNGSGKIQLVTKPWGDAAETVKEIIVGTLPPKITGRATVVAGNTYYYTIEKSDPNATLSIAPVVSPGGAPYQISLSGNQITLTTGSLPSNANDYLIRIRATETGTCGSATGTLNVRFRGGEGPIH